MNNKLLFRIIALVLVLIHIWYGIVVSQHAYQGIEVKKNSSGDWIIWKLEEHSASEKLNLKVGDTIQLVDGQHPDDYVMIALWGEIEQAETIIVLRDGNIIEVSAKYASKVMVATLLSLLGGIICLAFAYFIYFKARHSVSSRLLSLVFINIAFIFTSLDASIRGDFLGKTIIHTLMAALPIVFLHFLLVFIKEKAGVGYPVKFIRSLYGVVLVQFLLRFLYLVPAISQLFYKELYNLTIVFFILGLSLNFIFLIYTYIKHRSQNHYLSIIIKTVLWSLTISFAPFTLLSFIPLLQFWEPLIDTFYTAWFVLIFPLSFAYLIISKQLYDIDLVLRRVGFTIIIAIIPSAAIVGLTAIIFSKDVTVKHLLLSFIVTVTLLSFIIYSLEYFATKLQPVMFPRKHQLQLALKKISVNLQTISSYRELKEIILVDIVQTLELFGAAIAFKYSDRVEAVLAGDIDLAEVESLASADPSGVTPKRRFEINRHEEYTSYLIITRKKKNTFWRWKKSTGSICLSRTSPSVSTTCI